jgi:predicted DNA-binding transcriptional regulator YafY
MRKDAEANLFAIIEMMQRPNGASIKEICKELDCNRKTFDVQKRRLEEYDIPFYDKDDYNGNTNSKRWYIAPEWSNSKPLFLDHQYRIMLRMLLGRTRLFESAETKKMINVLKRKIESSFFGDKKSRVKTTYSNFKGTKSYEGKEQTVEKVLACIETRHPATVTYLAAKATEPKTYDIEPYTLVEHGNSLYVIVAIPKHNRDIRILALERIIEIKQSAAERFEVPESFDPEAYLNPSFGIVIEDPIRVVVRFSAESAIYARERTWGQEQTVDIHDDGSLTLAFTAAGKDEIKRWVLSFGADAQVLEPVELVESVKKELMGAGKLYG